MDTGALTQVYEQGLQDACAKMGAVRPSLMAKIHGGKKLLPAATKQKKTFPLGAPPGVGKSNPLTGAAAAAKAAAFYEGGVRDALQKFGAILPNLPEGVRRHLTAPKAMMLAGGGAGLWDMTHGRGLGGSLGTAVGTGGGGLLGGWGGGRIGRRFGPGGELIGQLAGTGLGAWLGRQGTKERLPEQPLMQPPMPMQPYPQPY